VKERRKRENFTFHLFYYENLMKIITSFEKMFINEYTQKYLNNFRIEDHFFTK
jgi:hypothetical protein